MVVFRSLEQPPADPALVGGCVLPVLSFNTKEEELAMKVASGEEHSVRQQRASLRDSVKTSAFEEQEDMSESSTSTWRCCLISWQTSLRRAAQTDVLFI